MTSRTSKGISLPAVRLCGGVMDAILWRTTKGTLDEGCLKEIFHYLGRKYECLQELRGCAIVMEDKKKG
jgi:hypothetical protein